MDEDLKNDILRANPNTAIESMDEDNLKEKIKTLAVKVESKLIHRIKMGQQCQSAGTSIRTYHVTLNKGLSKQCD